MDNFIKLDKFNKVILSKYVIKKFNPDNIILSTLLAFYMNLGCQKYPNEEKLYYFLQYNYDLSYEITPYQVGSYDIFRYRLSAVNPKLINDDDYNESFLIDSFNEFLKPVIVNNTFSQELLDKAKEIYLSEIYYSYEDHETIATNNALNYYFKDTLYSYKRIPNIYDVYKVTPKDLYNYYLSLQNEYNTSYILGDLDFIQPKSSNSVILDSHLFIDRGICSSKIIEKKKTNQAYLRVIYDGNIFSNDKLFYPALFINQAFGGSTNSKLFLKIREELALCYSISSTYYASSGILLVSAIINKNDVDKVIEEIDKIYTELLDDFDLEFIKNQFIYDKLEELDNINTYLANEFYDSHFPYMQKSSSEIEIIKSIVNEDIINAYSKLKRKFVYVYGGDLDE